MLEDPNIGLGSHFTKMHSICPNTTNQFYGKKMNSIQKADSFTRLQSIPDNMSPEPVAF